MTTTRVTGRTSGLFIGIDKLILTFSRHWLLVVNVMAGLFTGLTVAAPLLMALGLEGPAWVLYRFYALNCHQLPQRSYFLFGPDGVDTYSLEQILAWGADPGYLRGFVGNPEVGFKIAMAHRNTAIYAAVFLTGLAYALLRHRIQALPWKWYLILIAPMFSNRWCVRPGLLRRRGHRLSQLVAAHPHRSAVRPGLRLAGLSLAGGGASRHPTAIGRETGQG
jgi:uncharacterized membrane protein